MALCIVPAPLHFYFAATKHRRTPVCIEQHRAFRPYPLVFTHTCRIKPITDKSHGKTMNECAYVLLQFSTRKVSRTGSVAYTLYTPRIVFKPEQQTAAEQAIAKESAGKLQHFFIF